MNKLSLFPISQSELITKDCERALNIPLKSPHKKLPEQVYHLSSATPPPPRSLLGIICKETVTLKKKSFNKIYSRSQSLSKGL